MAKHPKEGKLLYHITALENVEGILLNGLLPRMALKEFKDIADKDILSKRHKYNLEEYTPFHFFSGTPFSGGVQKSNQDIEFAYLCIKRSVAEIKGFKIVPKHPVNFNGEPLIWAIGINEIDWDIMGERNFHDHNCKEVCMAEAIYKGAISLEEISCIYVKSAKALGMITDLLIKYKKTNLNVRIYELPAMFV